MGGRNNDGYAMRRYPNPWFAIPTLAGTLIGAGLGWSVTTATCGQLACYGWATIAAIVSGLIGMVGVGTVVVLAIRSTEEFREANAAGRPESEPECEVPEDLA